VFTSDSGVASIALVVVVEEACHILWQHLMVVVVLDEAVLGMTDTFAAEQGAGKEATEDHDNGIVREAGHCIPLVGGPLHFISVQ
jgi:hypothetical protein